MEQGATANVDKNFIFWTIVSSDFIFWTDADFHVNRYPICWTNVDTRAVNLSREFSLFFLPRTEDNTLIFELSTGLFPDG